jgi:hypothetical protein
MITYFFSVFKGLNTAWLLCGIAVRRAQEQGVHRGDTPSSQRTTMEGELWKCAYYNLMLLDMTMCEIFGRPRATTIQEYVQISPLTWSQNSYLSLALTFDP